MRIISGLYKGKKILLLGEYHINEDRCDKQVSKVFNPNEEYIMNPLSLIMHLAKMNEKTNNCFDFFLEDGYYTKNHIIDSSKIKNKFSKSKSDVSILLLKISN